MAESLVQFDFDCLLERMRQRVYPETSQVPAYYWFKTIYANGYPEAGWKALDSVLRKALADTQLPPGQRQSLLDVREWIRQARKEASEPSQRFHQPIGPTRQIDGETLVIYLVRLLNEWLPAEVAHLLIAEREEISAPSGIPALFMARALERILLREHLSVGTLETILLPGLLSPRLVYPADAEILRDVVLFLLGRTAAPIPDRLPATLVWVTAEAPMAPTYAEAVGGAFLSTDEAGAEELRVPISPSQAMDLLKADHLRITSLVVTMDGQLWQTGKLQSGEQNAIVYRRAGVLRIDYSGDHARLTVPWPEARTGWAGPVSFSERFELFGRKWRIESWEQDANRTRLHLVFAAALPVTSIEPDAKERLRRSRPVAVDMAWAELEAALAASVANRGRDAVEQLRRDELVPLGRALFGLAESVGEWRLPKMQTIETRINAVRFLSAELSPDYGLVPWRILPEPVRKNLLAHSYVGLTDLFGQVFEGFPEAYGGKSKALRSTGSWSRLWHARSPSRAA